MVRNTSLLGHFVLLNRFVALAMCAVGSMPVADALDYNRDVRPILAKNCFTCHGPDEQAREAGLRLDTAEGATEDLGGYQAIVPGQPDESEVIARLSTDDESLRMPPSDSHPPLSPKDIETLRQWIHGGAVYQTHWSFAQLRSVTVPEVKDVSWCRGPIDRFVKAKTESLELNHADEATKRQLIKRVFMDLVGVLPTPQQTEAFVADDSPVAYRRMVDRLLASPDYAENFARPWLDLARYADTNGYEKDRQRTIWPYRDWVIKAIGADMPMDEFSVQQLAGDMLHDATEDQKVATGFHRNTMLNEEGGIDPLEYRFYALVDRVATTGTVWMGLTVGCAQCHTHKYDPITHTDYYRMMALFDGADEPDLAITDRRAMQRREVIELQRQKLVEQLTAFVPDRDQLQELIVGEAAGDPIETAFSDFVESNINGAIDWWPIAPTEMESTSPKLTLLDDASVLGSGDVTKRDVFRLRFDLKDIAVDTDVKSVTALRLEALPHESLPAGGPGMAYYEGRKGDFFLSHLEVSVDRRPIELTAASHSYANLSVGSGKADSKNVIDDEGSTGWSTSGGEGMRHELVLNFREGVSVDKVVEIEMTFERHFAAALGRFRFAFAAAPDEAVASKLAPTVVSSLARLRNRNADLAEKVEAIDEVVYEQLKNHFALNATEIADSKDLELIRKEIEHLEKQLPQPVRTLVMQERDRKDHRKTRRHHRGEYLQARERVAPGIPSMFNGPANERMDEPPNRLSFARWLASDRNPLYARVTVNRAWRHFFGTGIVNTAGDFGTQSESPSHPQLLDWLATRWLAEGQSMKWLHRQIVLSATYRQSIRPSKDHAANQLGATDHPSEDRLLTRFPSRRYAPEQIRDAFLSASGLLERQIGGPSVYPPQPAAVMSMAYGAAKWPASEGGDRYRRSLYTHKKRTAPFAAFTTFDAPSGELCIARRDESTTPLQALTLLNDAMYFEIAKGLADVVLRTSGQVDDDETRINRMFVRLFARPATTDEMNAVTQFIESLPTTTSEASKWAFVARAVMNTDEAITTP